MIDLREFEQYLEYDEYGIKGIKDNTPDDMKKEFDKWFEKRNRNATLGIFED